MRTEIIELLDTRELGAVNSLAQLEKERQRLERQLAEIRQLREDLGAEEQPSPKPLRAVGAPDQDSGPEPMRGSRFAGRASQP